VEIEDESKGSEEAGMFNLLKKSDEECRMLRDLLEESAAARPDAVRLEELSEAWLPGQSAHIAECPRCQEAARDLLATRKIFAGVVSFREIERPWFASRVMAIIAARERELSEVTRTWMAVPKFASRLAMAVAAILLVASTWIFEKPSAGPGKQPTASAGQEYLFETPPPPMNQDDVLISMAEQNQ
jgi:hypothetical protein